MSDETNEGRQLLLLGVGIALVGLHKVYPGGLRRLLADAAKELAKLPPSEESIIEQQVGATPFSINLSFALPQPLNLAQLATSLEPKTKRPASKAKSKPVATKPRGRSKSKRKPRRGTVKPKTSKASGQPKNS